MNAGWTSAYWSKCSWCRFIAFIRQVELEPCPDCGLTCYRESVDLEGIMNWFRINTWPSRFQAGIKIKFFTWYYMCMIKKITAALDPWNAVFWLAKETAKYRCCLNFHFQHGAVLPINNSSMSKCLLGAKQSCGVTVFQQMVHYSAQWKLL